MSHTRSTRFFASLVGAACVIGTAWLLLEDVATLADITPKHYVNMLILTVATFTLHRAIGDAMTGQWLAAAPIGTIALVAIAIVTISAGGRYSAKADDANRLAGVSASTYAVRLADAEGARQRLSAITTAHTAAITLADAMVTGRLGDVAVACKDGNGTGCRGAKAVLEAAQDHARIARVATPDLAAAQTYVATAEARASIAVPARLAQEDGTGFARFLATVGLVSDEARAARVINALLPFALAVVIEIAAASMFVIAFPPSSVLTPVAPPVVSGQTLRAAAAAVPLIAAPIAAKAAVDDVAQGVAKLMQVLETKGDKPVTVTQAAKAMRCCRPEASRRIKAAGGLVATRKDGRYLYVTRA